MKLALVLCSVLYWAFCAVSARAQVADYFKYLSIAEKHVREQKLGGVMRLGEPARAIAMLGLSRRFYKPGETWTVAFTPHDDPTARMTSAPGELRTSKRKPVYFDYKVTDVDSRHLAHIKVRQKLGPKDVPIDSSIDYIELVVNSQFVTLRKEMHFRDGRAPAIVKTNGVVNIATGFNPYPIDLPALNTSDGQTLHDVPAALSNLAGFDPRHALEFKANDLYARPTRAIWSDGDVWPVYVETPAGTSVLVSQSK